MINHGRIQYSTLNGYWIEACYHVADSDITFVPDYEIAPSLAEALYFLDLGIR